MKLLVEVRNIRPCQDGHSCSLIANGKKVAFIAPDIFEWTSHSKMIDVLEWFSIEHGIKKTKPEARVLKDGWEREVPDYKNDQSHDVIQAQLLKWIHYHVQAYEVVQRCKRVVMAIDDTGNLIEYNCSAAVAQTDWLRSSPDFHHYKILNNLRYEDIVPLLLKGKSFRP